MHLGLLLCDHVRPEFLHIGGDYPDYFARLLPEAEWTVFDLTQGNFPASSDECDGWITSGSRHSVYDHVAWISRFAGLIRDFDLRRVPTVGICFGAQMMAHALGGRVERAEQGWQVGVKVANVIESDLLGSGPFRIIHSNADQVVEMALGMRLLATAPTNPIEAIALGDHFLGFQGHPEFDPAYSRELMEARRGSMIPSEVIDAALPTLTRPPDQARLATVIESFLLTAIRAQMGAR